MLAKKGVVACEMGRLYNKEAVIEMLLNKDRSASPPWASHIEKLKDVVELNLTINPAYEAKRKDAVGDGMYQDKLVSRFLNISILSCSQFLYQVPMPSNRTGNEWKVQICLLMDHWQCCLGKSDEGEQSYHTMITNVKFTPMFPGFEE